MITRSLKVLLNGKEVGRLSWDDRRNLAYFEFSQEWLQSGLDLFPIIASTKSPASRRPIWGEKSARLYSKLPPFLADSLPDSWGNQVFEYWRKANGIRNQEVTPLDILSFIGKRGMGALEFAPESAGISHSDKLNLQALTELAQRIFSQREQARILPNESLTMQSLIAVGTSAGGRQPKAIIAINRTTGEIRSGQIAELPDFDYCIIKFGDAQRCTAQLEMAYCDMAKAAGIEMMPSRLIDVEGCKHFITERFDRQGNRKIHMQTLAALNPEADSYELLLTTCRKLRLPAAASDEVFRRMVFNILANNTDDHNKNFSFLMNDDGSWQLSPAYDMTYIFNAGGYQPEMMHCLMMQGKLYGHTISDALALAKENGIRKSQSIIKEVGLAVANFRQFAEKWGVSERWISPIETCLNAHLADWNLAGRSGGFLTLSVNGKVFSNVHIEQAYRSNYHLLAESAGRNIKFVIGRNKPEYAKIETMGANNLSEEFLRKLLEKYF